MATCQLTEDLKYHICTYPVDMRKQISGLQGIVTAELGRYPVSGEAFIFVGKNRKTIKILHREGNGMTMYVRKLSTGRFQMPSYEGPNPTCNIDYRTFALLAMGEDPDLSASYSKAG